MTDCAKQAVQAERVDEWAAQVAKTFARFEIGVLESRSFVGRAATQRRLSLQVTRVAAAGQRAVRDPWSIRHFPSDQLFLITQLRGTCTVESVGDTAILHPGDSLLVDPEYFYALNFDTLSRQLCVHVPRWEFVERAGKEVISACGSVVRRSGGSARVLQAASEALLCDVDEEETVDIFLDVLSRAARGCLRDHKSAPSSARRLTKLHDFIGLHFREEGLNPRAAADELGCSVRNVHKLCLSSGRSFGRMVLAARLNAARSALVHVVPDERISSIAFESGFSDISHFCRSFKSEFGMSPKQFRSNWDAQR
jgi:AraC-like DNA-binding protein